MAVTLGLGPSEPGRRDYLQAWQLAQWLDGALPPSNLPPSMPMEVIRAMREVNRELWSIRLFQRLCSQLPAPLLRRIWGRFFPLVSSDPARLWKATVQGIPIADVLPLALECYADGGYVRPPQPEVDAVGWLLRQSPHVRLELIHACWTQDRQRLHMLLQRLDDSHYRHFVEMALRHKLMAPLDLLVSGRADAFLDVYLQLVAPDEVQLIALVERLLQIGARESLPRLTDFVLCCDEKVLQEIANLLERQPGVPPRFIHLVRCRISQWKDQQEEPDQMSGHQTGLFQRIRRIFYPSRRVRN